MNKYTIYCTKEQTSKALELGAPIYELDNEETMKERMSCEVGFNATFPSCGCFDNYSNKEEYPDITIIEVEGVKYAYVIPTAEQMQGWLTDKLGITTWQIRYLPCCDESVYGYLIIGQDVVLDNGLYKTSKEATLAAIDAALDYLTNKAMEE